MVNEKLSNIAQLLWDVDDNRLTRNLHYKINLQRKIKGNLNKDSDGDGISDLEEMFSSMTISPLFEYLDVKTIMSRPTYRTFVRLFDNYIDETEIAEVESEQESREQDDFLDACMKTRVMKEAHRFLVSQNKAPEDEKEFKKKLDLIWFDFYSRSVKEDCEDSSAFEHVFIGERKKNQKVLGCHNWLDYYYLERKGEIQYYGYIPSKTIYEDVETEDPGVLALTFTMDGVLKPLGGFLIGLSPEFEIALYTIIFLCGGQKTHLQFANLDIVFECFKMEREGRMVIATLFPTI